MPHLLARILRAQEAVRVVEGAVPDEAHRALGEMLQSLEHQHAFLWVHSQDGGYQELGSAGPSFNHLVRTPQGVVSPQDATFCGLVPF